MNRVAILLVLGSAVIANAQVPCEQLRSLNLPTVTISLAESVPVGPLPAHCRVAAALAPTPESHIEMELWLPAPDAWNGKFEALGNGGWAGTIPTGSPKPTPLPRNLSYALQEGYATAGTDTGHKGADAAFAPGNPEKLEDFADRAVHEMTVQAKAIIAAFYGAGPKLSYWNGCSTGGRQGLMEAQRYPDDFDGIVAGAPANYWTHLMAAIIWSAQANHEGQPGNLTSDKMTLLHDAVLRACDALDGVKDGVLEDPSRCKFDPQVLLCKEGDGPDCLTDAQVKTAREMYSGPIDPRTGQQIYPGLAPGSELGWDPVKGLQPLPIAESYYQYLVFGNPNWDYRKLNFDTDIALTDKLDHGLINATNPDLSAFFKHGGKLLQFHGWNDQEISPFNSVNYYKRVQARLGNLMKLPDSYRLFMVPGLMHCSGGPGANQFYPMAVLERWRELNIAPDRIIAEHVMGSAVDNTRPLCPYPEVAVYRGSGSIHDAGNFSCKAP